MHGAHVEHGFSSNPAGELQRFSLAPLRALVHVAFQVDAAHHLHEIVHIRQSILMTMLLALATNINSKQVVNKVDIRMAGMIQNIKAFLSIKPSTFWSVKNMKLYIFEHLHVHLWRITCWTAVDTQFQEALHNANDRHRYVKEMTSSGGTRPLAMRNTMSGRGGLLQVKLTHTWHGQQADECHLPRVEKGQPHAQRHRADAL